MKPKPMQTVSTTQFMAQMHEDTTIRTEVTKTLLVPGDDLTPPMYAVLVKVVVGD